jgi:hypothetical protein
MLQLLDLARENAALKRELMESRGEVEALRRLLAAIHEILDREDMTYRTDTPPASIE